MMVSYSLNMQFFQMKQTVPHIRHIIKVISIRNYCKNRKKDESPLKDLLENAASFEDLNSKTPEQQWATLPYLKGTNIRKQGEYAQREKHDPRSTSIILFPGQGSQYVGMGKELMKFPIVKDLFQLSSYILKYDLLKLCLEGPKEKLDQTEYAQPAIMVCSLAAIEKLKEERPNAVDHCVGTAGFSLGELTALVFAGALEFERALKLVQIRAQAMQLACETNKGGMATLLLRPDTKLNFALLKARQWALEKGDELPECKIANYLYPDCKVIAGSVSALEYLEKNYSEFKIKRFKRLPVSGAFHTNLMKPAVNPFKKALDKMTVSDPIVSVYSNVDGKRYSSAGQIRKMLPLQIVKPVKWEQLLHVVYERDKDEHFPRSFECGPGKSLKTILKNVNAKAHEYCFSVEA